MIRKCSAGWLLDALSGTSRLAPTSALLRCRSTTSGAVLFLADSAHAPAAPAAATAPARFALPGARPACAASPPDRARLPAAELRLELLPAEARRSPTPNRQI